MVSDVIQYAGEAGRGRPAGAIMTYRLEVGRDWKFIARYRKLLISSIRQARLICRPFMRRKHCRTWCRVYYRLGIILACFRFLHVCMYSFHRVMLCCLQNHYDSAANCYWREVHKLSMLLWSPYVIGQTIIFSFCFFLSSFFLLLLFFLA